jgi:arylformamidase
MQIYDISLPVYSGMIHWPGDPEIHLARVADMDKGDVANVSKIDAGVHTGTHVDAPGHFIAGARGADTLDLQILIGPAWVVQVADEVDGITAAVLEALAIPPGTTRLLFRTRNSAHWAAGDHEAFDTGFVAVQPDGARWLVEHGVHLVGVDYLSVAPFDDGVPTHRILLDAGVIPIEGLNLSAIAPGQYLLVCLPLKLRGADGAPARAILIRDP